MIRSLALAASMLLAAAPAAATEERVLRLACDDARLVPASAAPRLLVLCRASRQAILVDERNGQVVRRLGPEELSLTGARRSNAAVSPDGRLFALGFRDGTLAVWSAAGGPPLLSTKRAFYANSLAFLPDGSALLFDGVPLPLSGAAAPAINISGDVDAPNDLAFDAAHRRVAVAESDTQVRLFDTRNWAELAANRSEHIEPLSIAWDARTGRIAAGMADGRLLVLNPDSLAVERTLPGPPGTTAAALVALGNGHVAVLYRPQQGGPGQEVRMIDLSSAGSTVSADADLDVADAVAVRNGVLYGYWIDGLTLRIRAAGW